MSPGGGWTWGSRIPWRLPTPVRRTVRVAASPRRTSRGSSSAARVSSPTAPPNPGGAGGSGRTSIVCGRRLQPDRLGAGERRAEGEEGAVVALHHQVDRRRLELEVARAQREERLLEQRHPAVAPAVDVHHVRRQLLGERDVAHPEAAEGRHPARRDGGDVLAGVEIDRVEHLLADHRPLPAATSARRKTSGCCGSSPPGGWHAAEELLEGVVLVRGRAGAAPGWVGSCWTRISCAGSCGPRSPSCDRRSPAPAPCRAPSGRSCQESRKVRDRLPLVKRMSSYCEGPPRTSRLSSSKSGRKLMAGEAVAVDLDGAASPSRRGRSPPARG